MCLRVRICVRGVGGHGVSTHWVEGIGCTRSKHWRPCFISPSLRPPLLVPQYTPASNGANREGVHDAHVWTWGEERGPAPFKIIVQVDLHMAEKMQGDAGAGVCVCVCWGGGGRRELLTRILSESVLVAARGEFHFGAAMQLQQIIAALE